LQRAGRQFEVLTVKRGLDVVDGDVARRHGVRVEPDTHGVGLVAGQTHLGHAVDGRQAFDEVALGVVRQLQPVKRRRRQRQEQDR
jgi:hypothetical protein